MIVLIEGSRAVTFIDESRWWCQGLGGGGELVCNGDRISVSQAVRGGGDGRWGRTLNDTNAFNTTELYP